MNKKKKIVILVICAFVLITAAVSVPIAMSAVFDPLEYTHIQNKDVENSTLIVGSHLMHLSAITDELYKRAQDTAQDSENDKIYYKSELAGGQWYEISSATSVADITTDGTPVEVSVIEALNLRWHTKKDKITYDLLTGQSVSIFDTNDPYNYLKRVELQPIKDQRDNFVEKGDLEGSDEYSYNFIKSFYEYGQAAVHTPQTDECDRALDSLQIFYEQMAADDAPTEELNFIQKAQASVNAQREVLIMQNIEPFVELLNQAFNGKSRVGYEDPDDALQLCDYEFTPDHPVEYDEDGEPIEEDTPDYTQSDMLLTAVTNAVTNMSDTVLDNQSKVIGSGSTVLSSKQGEDMTKLMSDCNSRSFTRAEADVKELVLLENIGSNLIVDKEKERNLLTSSLTPTSMQRYRNLLKAGASQQYKQEAANDNVTVARLNKLLKEQVLKANGERGELEFFITATTDRMEPQDAIDYLDELIEGVEVLKKDPQEDDYKPVALQSIQEYKEWLEKKKSEILASMGGSLLDDLRSELEDAYMEKMVCLDNNDLNGAKKAEAKINALNALIEAEGGDDSGVGEAYQDALDALNNGDTDGLKEAMDALDTLAGVCPNAAVDAMKNLADAISTKIDAENAAGSSGDNGDGSGDGSGDGTGNGSGDGTGEGGDGNGEGGDLSDGQSLADKLSGLLDDLSDMIANDSQLLEGRMSADDLLNLLESLLGDLNSLSDDMQAAAVIALHMYAELTQEKDIKDLVRDLALRFWHQGNIYFYEKYLGFYEFIPLASLSLCNGYRYVFDNTNKKVILSEGSEYYEFRAFSKEVTRPVLPVSDEETDEEENDEEENIFTDSMITEAVFRGDVLIEESYSQDEFGYDTVYLIRGDLAVLANDPIWELAYWLYDQIVAASLPS